MSSAFSHLSRSVTRSGSSVTRGLFSAWSSSRHDGQPHTVRPLGRSTETSCESKTLQAQLNAIAAPIRKAFIFNQLMHALLLSFCRYFAKIADATGAMSLSLVKSQVKKFLSAACPQGPCAEAPFCVTMTVAIEFHSRALIRAHVRSRRHFAKLPHQKCKTRKTATSEAVAIFYQIVYCRDPQLGPYRLARSLEIPRVISQSAREASRWIQCRNSITPYTKY